jgi:septal ring factor EnvC (AmiA/AmiB activator)
LSAEPPPTPSAPPPAEPPSKPATADDLRGLRRWLLVAGVWAAAATAIAVIALVKANDASNQEETARTTGQLTREQKALSRRVDDVEGRLDELAPAEDVTRLDQRLKKVENAASKTSDRVEALGNDLDDLEGRVEDLEQAAESNTDTTETETTP